MISVVAFGQLDGALNDVGFQPTVGIREENPIAGGRTGAEMAGITLAQPAFRQNIHAQRSYSRIFTREQTQDFAGAIGRPVVDDDQLKAYPSLC